MVFESDEVSHTYINTDQNLQIKDTHLEKVPSNKTPALTKSTNVGIWVVGTSNQVFLGGS